MPSHYSKTITLLLLLITACSQPATQDSRKETKLVDPNAMPQVQSLYRNLKELAPKNTLFGHQATMAYGYSWTGEEGRSDVRDTTGSYPAVYGMDVGGIESLPDGELLEALYGYGLEDMIRWATEAYSRGAVVTYAWHKNNPVTKGTFYDKTPAMATLKPGGENHEAYKQTLDRLADFFKAHGEVPLIFRPWHEHNGDWFWWGKGFVSESDYIAVWRFTVEYLRDIKGVHNLLYAFSPDRSRLKFGNGKNEYFYAYPGDDYVDIFGLDNYWDVGHPANKKSSEQKLADFIESLEELVTLANERGKIAALTETGLDKQEDPRWWTDVMLAGINANDTTRQIAYLQVWRNANRETEEQDHFYVPYPGHPAAENFIQFREDPTILFEDDLPDLYAE